ncbi:MAG: 50S ribosomal protein L4, partial [Alloscardovia omnicolens]|nr:50S ribosomal protein L4 [Alloscardovia omnicolens]
MTNVTLNITDANGKAAGSVEAPVEIFGIEQDVVR